MYFCYPNNNEKEMIAFPNAKINIGLNITNKREDGFHDIETAFYPIRIHDALEIRRSEAFSFRQWGKDIPGEGGDNLCVRAYQLLKEDFDLPALEMHLLKQIPIGAGLGGGSADAAYTIRLMNSYLGLGLDDEQMEGYCRRLGSDCAFFIRNKPVFAYGRGDQFKPLQLDLSAYHIVLIKPPVHVSTAEAYAGVVPAKPEASLESLLSLPPEQWKGVVHNNFERSVFARFPSIAILKEELYAKGAVYASMSGSGSSVYGIFNRAVGAVEFDKHNSIFVM